MLFPQPRTHLNLQLASKRDQLRGFLLRRSAGVIVFYRISFLPARFEIIGIVLSPRSEDQRQRL